MEDILPSTRRSLAYQIAERELSLGALPLKETPLPSHRLPTHLMPKAQPSLAEKQVQPKVQARKVQPQKEQVQNQQEQKTETLIRDTKVGIRRIEEMKKIVGSQQHVVCATVKWILDTIRNPQHVTSDKTEEFTPKTATLTDDQQSTILHLTRELQELFLDQAPQIRTLTRFVETITGVKISTGKDYELKPNQCPFCFQTINSTNSEKIVRGNATYHVGDPRKFVWTPIYQHPTYRSTTPVPAITKQLAGSIRL